jgi:hypothetical protein
MKYIYEILQTSRDQGPFGKVSGKNKSWPKLFDGLNELGQDGWELFMPIYGPIHLREAAHYCEGFILKKTLK